MKPEKKGEGRRPEKWKSREPPAEKGREAKRPDELVGIVRVMETDLPGNKTVGAAVRRIEGVSFAMGNALARICPFAGKMVSDISEEEIKQLEDMIQNPGKYGIPSWEFNRRKDLDTGEDMHLSVSRLEITHRMDIDKLKKMKCYRGIRHIQGLPVRGQRTRSSFRHGKTVGVRREKAARTIAKKKEKR